MDRATLKERISKLSVEEKQQLKEYGDALKEIKKAIKELLNKKEIDETGGDTTGKTLEVY